MRIVTTTPFGTRPVTAGLMEHQARGRAEPAIGSVDKWQVLNALGLIARDYGIGDRTLSVLQVLLSFHPDQVLRDGTSMVVFASNAAICDRAHGMPESTLRRHIAALVEAGLILRHDSPNGKRYARRGRGGEITRAFGFDLRPLLVLAPEIAARAAEETARREHVDAMREEVSLLLRDALKLVAYGQTRGGMWDALDDRAQLARRYLRRKLTLDQLTGMRDEMQALVAEIRDRIEPDVPQPATDETAETKPETVEMSGRDTRNERHYQRSDKDLSDKRQNRSTEPVSVALVLESCPDVLPYLDRRVTDWESFISAICPVAPMIGLDAGVWGEACRNMGPRDAAITVAAMVQRIGTIGNPGAYFRTLARKAGEGDYSPLPLLLSLSRIGDPRRAA